MQWEVSPGGAGCRNRLIYPLVVEPMSNQLGGPCTVVHLHEVCCMPMLFTQKLWGCPSHQGKEMASRKNESSFSSLNPWEELQKILVVQAA